jgi:hypothetical protein
MVLSSMFRQATRLVPRFVTEAVSEVQPDRSGCTFVTCLHIRSTSKYDEKVVSYIDG